MKIKKANNKSIFLFNIILLIIILFLSFIILEPKISSKIFYEKRETLVDRFYYDLDTTTKLEGKNFWIFREFYSPGYFVFDREGMSEKEINLSKQIINQEFIDENLFFLKYESKYIRSIEMLSKESDFESVLAEFNVSNFPLLKKGENYVLLKGDGNLEYLIFLLTGEEMERANGFFDYKEEDAELVKNKNWVVVSEVEIN